MTAPLVLLILDGWGIARPGASNPVSLARLTTFPSLLKRFPNTRLQASGAAVGLPTKQVGNSEAGHMNIGAGRVVEQDAVRINREIANGLFFKNSAILDALAVCRRHKSRLHLLGLLTDGESGHAFPRHLQALLRLALVHGNPPVSLHLFTDGRDTAKFAATELAHALEKTLQSNQSVSTLMGRFWGMDRAKRWSRTEAAYNALVLGRGRRFASAEQAILAGYKRGESDEFLAPSVVGSAAAIRDSRIRNGDAVIFFNLRSDRARQITKPFVQENFERLNPGSFRRKKTFQKLRFVAMTDFGPDLPNIRTAYPSIDLDDTLPFALKNFRQLYIAETEKFAHVTFFFNGGHAAAVAGEDRVMVPSYNVSSYDAEPAMATPEITNRMLRALQERRYDVLVANFANADMVGHTGNLQAGIDAVRVIDQSIARLVPAVQARDGIMIITADHGNIEDMLNEKTGEVDTEHNGNPVPFLLISPRRRGLRRAGKLADVAPTILALLRQQQPKAMKGHSLLIA